MLYRLTLLALFFVVAMPAAAASLGIAPAAPEGGTGKQLVLEVHLLPEGAAFNVVEGAIAVPDGVVIDRLDTAGSAVALWIEHPTYVRADQEIRFLGGVPQGFPATQGTLLFTIRAHARTAGDYVFAPGTVTAYHNDGTGGTEAVTGSPVQIAVRDTGEAQVAPRRTGVLPLIVDRGQDPALYDNQQFLAFYGGDAGQGIDHYEVREGWWSRAVRTDGTYVLRDQSLHSTIWVSAVAPDGSRTTATIPAERVDYIAVISVIGMVLLVATLLRFLRRLP